MLLQPDGRHGSEAEDVAVDPDLQLAVDRHPPAADAAEHAVERERGEKRQPLEEEAPEEGVEAAEGEAEQSSEDPRREPVAVEREAARREDEYGEPDVGGWHQQADERRGGFAASDRHPIDANPAT